MKLSTMSNNYIWIAFVFTLMLVTPRVKCLSFFGGDSKADDGLDVLCSHYNCTCPSSEADTIVDCSHHEIEELPENIAFGTTIIRVSFQDNKLKWISGNSLYSGFGVLLLDLSHNRIDSMDNNAFAGLVKLTQLVLSHNALWTLPLEVFNGLDKLELLDLSYNKFHHIIPDVFKPCISLKQLKLSYNLLMMFHADSFQYVPKLESLYVDNNGIQSLPHQTTRFPETLKRLFLGDNPLEAIPTQVLSKLQKLVLLDLSGISVAEIKSGDFEDMKSVTTLILSKLPNLVKYQAYAFCGLKNLHTFQSKLNPKLKTIHKDAFRCENSTEPSKIQDFTLSNNAVLQSLPEDLLVWSNITFLDLTENPWKCDCNLKWMTQIKVPKQLVSHMKCEYPKRHNGRAIPLMSSEDMKCGFEFDLVTTLGLMVAIVLGMVLTGIIVLAYRQACCFKCRAKRQAKYVRVVASKDKVDLEWDNSAEPE